MILEDLSREYDIAKPAINGWIKDIKEVKITVKNISLINISLINILKVAMRNNSSIANKNKRLG